MMRRLHHRPGVRRWRTVVSLLVTLAVAGPALAFESPARQAILIEQATGAVLFEKDADAPVPPASMSSS